jgi:hypothetical protein
VRGGFYHFLLNFTGYRRKIGNYSFDGIIAVIGLLAYHQFPLAGKKYISSNEIKLILTPTQIQFSD